MSQRDIMEGLIDPDYYQSALDEQENWEADPDIEQMFRDQTSSPDYQDIGPHDVSEQIQDEELSRSDSSDFVSSDYSEDQEVVLPEVIHQMEHLQDIIDYLGKGFRLINKIGEGTFSTVYKAEDFEFGDSSSNTPTLGRSNNREDRIYARKRKPKYVAVKQIYVTASPTRIRDELWNLKELAGSKYVTTLITAFRHEDQVFAVFPFYKHHDFSQYFNRMSFSDIRYYFTALFKALAYVHEKGFIHRDIKPGNFLYDYQTGTGVLVDFGLSHETGTYAWPCMCTPNFNMLKQKAFAPPGGSIGYPNRDVRPPKRANRAGTRGFRAPEVLLKCTDQTPQIDVWSAGVLLLTILTKHLPFFNSTDDMDAMIELATVFGRKKMTECAALHGMIFETTIPTINECGFPLKKIILHFTDRTASGSGTCTEGDEEMSPDEAAAVALLDRCLELDPSKRITAAEALNHEFFVDAVNYEDWLEDSTWL